MTSVQHSPAATEEVAAFAPRRRRVRAGVEKIPVWLWVVGVIVGLYLVLPTLIVIPMSFSKSATFAFPPQGFTWQLYENFFTSSVWLQALRNSVVVGVLVAVVATALGTAAALAFDRLTGRVAGFIRTLMLIPLVAPGIVLATAIYITFLQWQLTGTLLGFVLAHTALALPYVIISVTTSLAGFDSQLLRAAASLGASPVRSFLRITAPLISRGILTGAIFAFVTSFDEVVIALFLHSPTFQTLPVQMYNSVTADIDPTISAASSLIVVIVTLLFLVPLIFRRPDRNR